MSYVVICTVALLSSGLTFFSGFGLGTLLLPAFAMYFPVEQAVALTAVVHFLNSLFKVVLVGHHANSGIVLRFGLPAIVASFGGASALLWLSSVEGVISYSFFGHTMQVMPVKVVVGLLLLVFVALEVVPQFRDFAFPPRYMLLGGLLSGFFGGLTGMQGALRSAFLSRAGLTKETFVATGVVLACLIDLSRLGVYSTLLATEGARLNYRLLTAAVLSAFIGAASGNRFLRKMTMPVIQRIVTVLLFIMALGLIGGIL